MDIFISGEKEINDVRNNKIVLNRVSCYYGTPYRLKQIGLGKALRLLMKPWYVIEDAIKKTGTVFKVIKIKVNNQAKNFAAFRAALSGKLPGRYCAT